MYPGEYTMTEVAPAPGFQMKEPATQRVIIHGGESKTLTFLLGNVKNEVQDMDAETAQSFEQSMERPKLYEQVSHDREVPALLL